MSTVPIACASCGAPLELPEQVSFATCSHCGTALAIQVSGGAHYSEIRQDLQQLKQGVAHAAASSKLVAKEIRLSRLSKELGEQEASLNRLQAKSEQKRAAADSQRQAVERRQESLLGSAFAEVNTLRRWRVACTVASLAGFFGFCSLPVLAAIGSEPGRNDGMLVVAMLLWSGATLLGPTALLVGLVCLYRERRAETHLSLLKDSNRWEPDPEVARAMERTKNQRKVVEELRNRIAQLKVEVEAEHAEGGSSTGPS